MNIRPNDPQNTNTDATKASQQKQARRQGIRNIQPGGASPLRDAQNKIQDSTPQSPQEVLTTQVQDTAKKAKAITQQLKQFDQWKDEFKKQPIARTRSGKRDQDDWEKHHNTSDEIEAQAHQLAKDFLDTEYLSLVNTLIISLPKIDKFDSYPKEMIHDIIDIISAVVEISKKINFERGHRSEMISKPDTKTLENKYKEETRAYIQALQESVNELTKQLSRVVQKCNYSLPSKSLRELDLKVTEEEAFELSVSTAPYKINFDRYTENLRKELEKNIEELGTHSFFDPNVFKSIGNASIRKLILTRINEKIKNLKDNNWDNALKGQPSYLKEIRSAILEIFEAKIKELQDAEDQMIGNTDVGTAGKAINQVRKFFSGN